MPGIEFVDGAPGVDADELLESGPRRRIPRPILVAAVLAVAALAVAGVITGPHGSPRTHTGTPITPRPSATPAGPVPQVTSLVADDAGGHLYYVLGERLYQTDAAGRPGASAVIRPGGGEFSNLRLVPDPAEDTIWVVSDGSSDTVGGTSTVEGFRTDTMRRVVTYRPAAVIDGAATLNGALYVLADGRLERVDTRSGVQTMARLDPRDHALVTGPDGAALLYLEGQGPVRVGRWTPSGTSIGQPVPLADVSLAVAGGTAWLAGHTAARASLASVGPFGLAPGDRVGTGLSDGIAIVATGRRSLLVLGLAGGSGGESANGAPISALELICVDARTGRIAGRAPGVSANVAVLRGRAYEAVGSGVRRVGIGSCPG